MIQTLNTEHGSCWAQVRSLGVVLVSLLVFTFSCGEETIKSEEDTNVENNGLKDDVNTQKTDDTKADYIKTDDTKTGDTQKEYRFKFENDLEGWQVDFADYPPKDKDFYDLESGHQLLPAELGQNRKALFVSGMNSSDDLFMFFKRQVTGLEVNTTYQVSIVLTFASNVPQGCAGIGGAPDSIWVKAGATLTEPTTKLDDQKILRMTIDKGNQSLGGKDAIVLGKVGNKSTKCNNSPYEFVSLDNIGKQPFSITTGSTGEVWLLVGTDSGFESRTSLYYTDLQFVFSTKEE